MVLLQDHCSLTINICSALDYYHIRVGGEIFFHNRKTENAEEKFDFVTDLTNGWDRRKTDKVHALKLNFALKLLLFSFAAAMCSLHYLVCGGTAAALARFSNAHWNR